MTLSDRQILAAAEACISQTIGTAPTLTIRDIYRTLQISPTPSASHRIRAALMRAGFSPLSGKTTSRFRRYAPAPLTGTSA